MVYIFSNRYFDSILFICLYTKIDVQAALPALSTSASINATCSGVNAFLSSNRVKDVNLEFQYAIYYSLLGFALYLIILEELQKRNVILAFSLNGVLSKM